MRRRKLADSSKAAYSTIIERIYGQREPTFAPSFGDLAGGTRTMLRAALKNYWRHKDPALGARLAESIEPIESEHRFRVIPGESGAKKFEEATRHYKNTRAKHVVLLTLGFGFRAAEVLGLTRDEFEHALKVGYITVVGKGAKTRALPIDKAREAMKATLKLPAVLPHAVENRPDDLVEWMQLGHLLATPGSQLVTQRNMLARHIKTIAVEASLATEKQRGGWSPHMLRHIFSTRMTRDGAPYPYVAFALGHTGHGTTMTYQHPTVEDLLPFMRSVRL